MRIEQDIKLDFKDVLIRPKRSTLASRREVDIKRRYTFKWSAANIMACRLLQQTWTVSAHFQWPKLLPLTETV